MAGRNLEPLRSIPVVEVLERYTGLRPNRQGFCRCPLHSENTGSFKVYPNGKGWYCFGCHAGGDSINLVMALFGYPFIDAAIKLDSDFGLGVFSERPATEMAKIKRENAERLAERKKQTAEYAAKEDEYARCVFTLHDEGADPYLKSAAAERMAFLDYFLSENKNWR